MRFLRAFVSSREKIKFVNLLAVETATEACSVALSIDGETRQRFEIAPRRHGDLLLPWVKELLSEAGLAFSGLDALAVSRGPGGFTGVRLGVAAAQGLALAHDLPVHPVSSLAALAFNSGAERVLALLDARMGEVYAGWYEISEGRIREVAAERVCAPEKLQSESGSWTACGPGLAAYDEAISSRLGDALSGRVEDIWPDAAAVARLAGQYPAVSADRLQPVYLRDRVAYQNG